MELLKGPFGSWNGFLSLVALDNCSEYFRRAKAIKEEPAGCLSSQKRELARLLFNAVVSLDSVVDYKCHESTPPLVPNALAKSVPALDELRHVANALKHRIRGWGQGQDFERNPEAKHAVDQASAHVVVEIAVNGPDAFVTDIAYEFELEEAADAALEEAYRYWISRLP